MRTFTFVIILLLLSFVGDCQQSWLWKKTTLPNNHADVMWAIATDHDGNSYVTGEFRSDTLDFGNIQITAPWGPTNIYVAKYSKNGDCIWAKAISASLNPGQNSFSRNISIDNFGNCYVIGTIRDRLIFDSQDTLIGNGVFICKFDTAGNYKWSAIGLTDQPAEIYSVTTDFSGNIYVGGYCSDTTVFASDTLLGYNAFIAVYDSLGIYNKNIPFITTAAASIHSVFVSSDNNILVTGRFADTLIINNTILVTDSVFSDIFITKIDTAGNLIFAKSIGGPKFDFGVYITTDRFGNILLVGSFNDSLQFAGNPLVAINGTYDGILLKFDSLGNEIWGRKFGGTNNNDSGNSACTDLFGNIYVNGIFENNIDFNGNIINSNGRFNRYIAKYDKNGYLLDVHTIQSSTPGFVSSFRAISSGISIDVNGNIYTAGFIDSSYTLFDADTLYNASLTYQSFIAKLGCNGNAAEIYFDGTALQATPAASYQWYYNDNLLSGATAQTLVPQGNGDYFVLVTDSNGCRSYSNVYSYIDVGIDHVSASQFNLFPNPANKNLRISGNEFIHFQLFDRYGKEVIYSNLKTIDVSMLADGIYIYKIWIDADRFIPGKIVVMNN